MWYLTELNTSFLLNGERTIIKDKLKLTTLHYLQEVKARCEIKKAIELFIF